MKTVINLTGHFKMLLNVQVLEVKKNKSSYNLQFKKKALHLKDVKLLVY